MTRAEKIDWILDSSFSFEYTDNREGDNNLIKLAKMTDEEIDEEIEGIKAYDERWRNILKC